MKKSVCRSFYHSTSIQYILIQRLSRNSHPIVNLFPLTEPTSLLSKGVVPTKIVWAERLEAETIVGTSLVKFIHERLVSHAICFPYPIERIKLARIPSKIKKYLKKLNGMIAISAPKVTFLERFHLLSKNENWIFKYCLTIYSDLFLDLLLQVLVSWSEKIILL